MKFRKLTGILVALSLVTAYVEAAPVSIVSYGASTDNETETPVVATSSSIESLFEGGLNTYLLNHFNEYTTSKSLRTSVPQNGTIKMDPNTGAFPVTVPKQSLETLAKYANNGYTVELTFKISDPSGYIYNAKITAEDAAKLSKAQLNTIEENGGLSLALGFATGDEKLEIKGYNILLPESVTFPVYYNIGYRYFAQLVTESGLDPVSITENDNLGMYSRDTYECLDKTVDPDVDLSFTMNNKCRKGIFLKRLPDPDHLYTNDEAEDVIRDYVYDFLGFGKDGTIKGINSDFANTKDYIEDTVIPYINGRLPDISEYDQIIEEIENFCTKNKGTLIDKFVSDIDIDSKIEDVIDEVLTDDEISAGEKELHDYIHNYVTDYVSEQLKAYNVDMDNKIAETIKNALDKAVVDLKAQIINDIKNNDDFKGPKGDKGDKGDTGAQGPQGEQGAAGTDGLSAYEIAVQNGFKGTIAEWLESLYGKNGTAGSDGEDFESWMIRNYGSKENFMQQISFEGWAKRNYGSVDNFIKTVTKENGLSAYDLAVQNGYRGTLTQWLASLKGEDGLSAYEIAVNEGFRGDVDDWLESLKGEDGEDGRDGMDGQDGRDGIDGVDGRDGQDGQIVYVNGTYGQVTQDTITGADVVLVPTPSKPSAGNVNPATGVAAGIVIPGAIVGSVLLLKKDKRKRGRK